MVRKLDFSKYNLGSLITLVLDVYGKERKALKVLINTSRSSSNYTIPSLHILCAHINIIINLGIIISSLHDEYDTFDYKGL